MSRRRLSDEERVLWTGVTRSIKPLRTLVQEEASGPPAVKPPANKLAAKSSPRPAPVMPAYVPPPQPKPATPPLAPLGRRLKKRMARGSHAIDGRLDLHGLTQIEAHHALAVFLRNAQDRGASVVLVITGKGARGGDGYDERGVLRRQVPMWLRMPEFRSFVVGFEAASHGHGGEGALYVRLRRLRGE